MLRAAKIDLEDVLDALEHLHATLERLTREEKVDVAARLRSAAKTVELIDKSIKEDIDKWRKGKPGEVKGEIFKAVLGISDVTRLNQKLLKEEQPEIHKHYSETKPETRITFSPR